MCAAGVDVLGLGAEMRALAQTRQLESIPPLIQDMLLYHKQDDDTLSKIKESAEKKGIEQVCLLQQESL